jgi:hypothetical protein
LTNSSATNKKPSCLILDEIDGVAAPSAKFLLSRIQAVETKNKKGKKNELGPLKRPIICICNDPYVPALRELRKEALIVNFNGIGNVLAILSKYNPRSEFYGLKRQLRELKIRKEL